MSQNITTAEIIKIHRLYDCGLSAGDIQDKLNIPETVVQNEIARYLREIEGDIWGEPDYEAFDESEYGMSDPNPYHGDYSEE